MKTAHWKIKKTNETLSCLITFGFDRFKMQIESHAGMIFLGFSK